MEKTRDYILYKEIQEIKRINKTKSTLFRNKKGLNVGTCHGVCDLSYDYHLYIS